MKLIHISVLLLLFVNVGFAQDNTQNPLSNYENFLEAIKPDTLIVYKEKRYKCSEDVSGRLSYFYRKDTLKLIEHVYKQGFYEDYIVEHYYIEANNLMVYAERLRIAHLNTHSNTNTHSSSFSAGYVYELIERRTQIDHKTLKTVCYIRGEGKEMSESKTMAFEKTDCVTDLETINDKYKFLLKLEKKFLPIHHKGPACIYHVW